MKLFIIRKNGINATAEYDSIAGTFTVLKESVVSEDIAYSEKFRGSLSIKKQRKDTVTNGVVNKDVIFKSASTAANYVTGSSTNGLTAWKTADKISLKDYLKEDHADE